MLRTLFAFIVFIASTTSQAAPVILVLGDSLSAGYGIAQDQSWPVLLGQRLQAGKYPYTVTNISISGETTQGGLSRLGPALKQQRPAIVIIALGANDGLRGLPLEQMRNNLDAMIKLSQSSRAQVLLLGMRLPPNYGLDYTQKFQQVYADLARQHKTALLPFLFAGFAERPEAFQNDGLHPTAASQPLLLDNIWRALKPLLKKP
ncbi:MAG: arylesterase [Betaproteobacteria bacterium]|nr:arylesterase [Betaproteobacteria bacterium]